CEFRQFTMPKRIAIPPGQGDPMEAARFWNRAADRYAKSPIRNTAAYETTLDRVRAHLKPTDRALEFGCGTGTTALRLASCVARYTASDLASAMIAIGERRALEAGLGNRDFAVGRLQDSRFEPASYDVVLSFNVLHLLEDLPATLGRIRELLRPGGRFISKTPCWPDQAVPLTYRALRLVLPVMRAMGKAPEY